MNVELSHLIDTLFVIMSRLIDVTSNSLFIFYVLTLNKKNNINLNVVARVIGKH